MTDDPQEVTTPRRAVPKRLRFEILRRDGHACRYCGAMAPDVKLTVDHVIPVVLGGSDDPSNLVAACVDCNAGKASVQPGSDVVEDVAADALRWKRAIEMAAASRFAEREVLDSLFERFETAWYDWTWERRVRQPDIPPPVTGDPLFDNWHRFVLRSFHCVPVSFSDGVLTVKVRQGWRTDVRRDLNLVSTRNSLATAVGAPIEQVELVDGFTEPLPTSTPQPDKIVHDCAPLPESWRDSVQRFISNGLPEDEMLRLVEVTMNRRNLALDDRFRFFCGCCWRAITDLQEDARRFLEAGD